MSAPVLTDSHAHLTWKELREDLDGVLDVLPSMRQPTIAALGGEAGFAVRAAVPRAAIADLVPRLKQLGGSDIVLSGVSQLVP